GAAFDHSLRIPAIEFLIMVELGLETADPLRDRAEIRDQLVQRRAGQERAELVPAFRALYPVEAEHLAPPRGDQRVECAGKDRGQDEAYLEDRLEQNGAGFLQRLPDAAPTGNAERHIRGIDRMRLPVMKIDGDIHDRKPKRAARD